jgi:AcrR family transcriptional regulator
MVTTRSHAAVRMPRAARREQLIRAAAAAFLASGYDKTSMEDVAKTAGVTRLIVYRIFESKEALYLAVIASVLDDIAEQFEIEPERMPIEQRATIAAKLLGIARRQPDGFRLLWRHTSNQPEFHELFTLFKSETTQYAVALIKEVSDNPLIVRWAAESVVSHLYESICLWLDAGDPALDEDFLRMLGSGVRAMIIAWFDQEQRPPG